MLNMNDTGLNKFDWIGLGIGLGQLVAGIAAIIIGTKANNIRMNNYQDQMRRIGPKT